MPSKKAMARERAKVREMTASHQCHKQISALITELNRHLLGWANCFGYGQRSTPLPRGGWYVRKRLAVHFAASQRPFRPPAGTTLYRHLTTLGLVNL